MQRLIAALLILLSLGAGTATAAPIRQGLYPVAERSTAITLDQATEQVRRETGGRILSAETINKNGQRVHRIKVLTPDHRVVIREIHAGGR